MAKTFDQIVTELIQYVAANDPSVTAFTVGSRARTLLEAVAQQLADLSQTIDVSIAGSAQDAVFSAFNFPALPPQYASGVAVFTGNVGATFPTGGLVSTTPSSTSPTLLFQALAPIVIGSGGTGSGLVQATTAGPQWNIQPGQLTTITSLASGITNVTNTSAFTGGAYAETPTQQSLRFAAYIQSLGLGTPLALEVAASTTAGVDVAAVVETPYINAITMTSNVATDNSEAANMPYGPTFPAFNPPINTGDAWALGAPVPWTDAFIDIASPGAGITGSWQYWSVVNNAWTALPTITDGTATFTQSGTLNWTQPSDWGPTGLGGTSAWFIQYAISSGGGTAPQINFVEGLNPPAGVVNIVVTATGEQVPDEATLNAVSVACDAVRSAGVMVNTIPVTLQQVNVTMNLLISPLVNVTTAENLAITAVESYLNSLTIGAPALLQQMQSAVLAVNGGGTILQCTFVTPTLNVYVLPNVEIVSGTVTVGEVVT